MIKIIIMTETQSRISNLKDRVGNAWRLIKIDEKKQRVIELQALMSEAGFWNDQERAKRVGQEASDLEFEVEAWEKLMNGIKDISEMAEMDAADQTVNLSDDINAGLDKLEKQFNDMEFQLLFSDKYDQSNAIVAIHAGAGGTDAQDWAEMLLRMYLRFCEKQKWKTQIITISSGGEAGVKSVLFEVRGKYSYGYLKSEAGVHRLVRISPFDAEKMRHTSFALVEVLPELEEVTKFEIDSEELRIDVYRAGGHGGQSVNTTDSAVRITHLPTGIVVTCQNERSQLQNKETAMKVLRSKLQKYYETEVEEERKKLRGEFTEAAWGNQARSYVIHPYKMVKDHRTGYESTEVEKVLEGELMPLIEAYLRNKIK
jgi:peptide chain release factor 2